MTGDDRPAGVPPVAGWEADDRRAAGELRAAGAVVLRATAWGPEVALVHRPRYGDWSLPKGKLRPDESWPVAAVRETREETGLDVRLGAPVGSAAYDVRGRRKIVRYWAASALGEPGRRIGDEVDELGWFPLDRALELLGHENERAVTVAAAQSPPSVPMVIARHAKAFPRTQWHAADPDRPLAKRGNDEAVRLAGLLSAWAPARVVSSPAKRCRDTVTPYAAVGGATVELEMLLSEEGHDGDRAAVAALMLATRASLERQLTGGASASGPSASGPSASSAIAPTGMVLCTHRPVLPTIAAALGIGLSEADSEEALPPAGCWVLHLTADGGASLEQHGV